VFFFFSKERECVCVSERECVILTVPYAWVRCLPCSLHGAQTDENVDGFDLRGEYEPRNGHHGTGAEDGLESFQGSEQGNGLR